VNAAHVSSRDDPARDAWIEQARAIPTLEVATRLKWTPLRKGAGVWASGACPACGTTGSRNPKRCDRFSVGQRAPRTNAFKCRACGISGGDGIALVQKVLGLDFLKAVEHLAGPPPTGTQWTAAERAAHAARLEQMREARLERERLAAVEAAQAAQEKVAHAMRLWGGVGPWRGTLAEDYLLARGIQPGNLRNLGFHASLNLRNEEGTVLHNGPAMCGLITGPDGRGMGVHRTWLDLANPPKFRPTVIDPETGDTVSTKKMLGLAEGGAIRLIDGEHPRRIIIGEGIETLLSVHTALTRLNHPWLARCLFWCALSIGNLAPVLGRMDRPATLTEAIILGDGDSHPEDTRRAVDAAAAAALANGFTSVRTPFAPGGTDFNDVIRGAA
jgi:phage/plasmid primase-like uncharacterized protein